MAALAKLEQSSRAHSRECVPTTVSAAYSKWRHGGGSGTARRHSVRAELAMAIVTAVVVAATAAAAVGATNHPQSILVYGSNRRLASFLSRLRCS